MLLGIAALLGAAAVFALFAYVVTMPPTRVVRTPEGYEEVAI